MQIIALSIFIVLAIVAFTHGYWAFGGHWPASSRATLPQTVVGSKGLKQMPPFWLTMIVAVLILIAGLLPVSWVFFPVLPNILWFAMMTLAAIFWVRGIASYTPIFRKLQAEEPFATLDRKYFGPLCIALGLGFVILLV